MDGRVYGTDIYNQGEYRDRFRRVDGRWLFSERILTLDGYDEAGNSPDVS